MSDALAPIFAALAADQTLPAWDVDDPNDPTLSVFDISGAPKQTAYISVPLAERKAYKATLAQAGFINGAYCRGTDLVWRHTVERFEIWSTDGLALTADTHEIRLASGVVIPRGDVTAVVPSLSASGITRGLHLRAGATSYTIVEVYEPAVSEGLDPAPNAWDDVRWMSSLGYKLSHWLAVPIAP